MTSQVVTDFLTKQIFIERNIVTYRSLSRDLKINVNVAKNELATYHAIGPYESHSSRSAATYLLSGEAVESPTHSSQGDDVDMNLTEGFFENGEGEHEGEVVSATKVVLVNEKDLEVAKSQFTRLDTIHVYSLAPVALLDAGLLCVVTDRVRETDTKQGGEIASVVGKVVGKNIKIKAAFTKGKAPAQPVAGPSKLRSSISAAPVTKAMEKATIKEAGKEEEGVKDKKTKGPIKQTGKLGFSKLKPKETKKLEVVDHTSTKEMKVEKASLKPNVSRGTKRKSAILMSESEDDQRKPVATPIRPMPVDAGSVRLKNRTILSDDDDDNILRASRKFKSGVRVPDVIDSDAENNAKALMDVDDDQVVRVTRGSPVAQREEQEEDLDDDVEMGGSIVLRAKTKKIRQKKVVPVGRNGLKKKRVVKSRMAQDAKGYTITEDYSSYESVDEIEEAESAPVKTKQKAKAKAKPSTKIKQEEEGDSDSISATQAQKLKPATKSKTSSRDVKTNAPKGQQKNLKNFFSAPSKSKG